MLEVYWLHCNKCGCDQDIQKNVNFILFSCQDVLCSKCFSKCLPSSSVKESICCILCNALVRTVIIEESMNPSLKKLFTSVKELTKYSLNDIRAILEFQKKQRNRRTKLLLIKNKKIQDRLNGIEDKLKLQQQIKKKNLQNADKISKYKEEMFRIDAIIKQLQNYYNKHIKYINNVRRSKKNQTFMDFDKSASSNYMEKIVKQSSFSFSSKSNDIISLNKYLINEDKVKTSNTKNKETPLSSREIGRTEERSFNEIFFNPLLSSTPLLKKNKKMLIEDGIGSGISPILSN
uniref:RING-type domain-containing protein n=1 Tax=Strongyloides stercoralis TaxID=6248 RepID=A0A0K0ECK5_STRER